MCRPRAKNRRSRNKPRQLLPSHLWEKIHIGEKIASSTVVLGKVDIYVQKKVNRYLAFVIHKNHLHVQWNTGNSDNIRVKVGEILWDMCIGQDFLRQADIFQEISAGTHQWCCMKPKKILDSKGNNWQRQTTEWRKSLPITLKRGLTSRIYKELDKTINSINKCIE